MVKFCTKAQQNVINKISEKHCGLEYLLVLRKCVISDGIVILMCITIAADTVLTKVVYCKDISLFGRINLTSSVTSTV